MFQERAIDGRTLQASKVAQQTFGSSLPPIMRPPMEPQHLCSTEDGAHVVQSSRLARGLFSASSAIPEHQTRSYLRGIDWWMMTKTSFDQRRRLVRMLNSYRTIKQIAGERDDRRLRPSCKER